MIVDLEQEVDAAVVAFARLVLGFDAERGALLAAERQEDRLVALGEQVIDREIAAERLAVAEVPAEIDDDVGFERQRVLGQAIAGDADLGHAAGLLGLLEHVDMVAVEQQVVGGGDAGGAGADHGHLYAVLRPLDHVAGEFERVRALLLVGDVALQRLDADRLVDELAPAGEFAVAHADAAAGGGHRVFLQEDAERVLRLAVADVVDVARHVDLGRAGLDAGRGHVGHAVLGLDRMVAGDFLLDPVAEIVDDVEERHGASLAEAAERGRLHLRAEQFDVVEIERRIETAAHLVERVAH